MRCERIALLVATLVAAALMGACSDGGSFGGTATDTTVPRVMQSEPSVSGHTMEVGTDGTTRFRLVDASKPYFDRALVRLAVDAPVLSETGAMLEDGRFTNGMTVNLWIGACAESAPPQCVAEAVQVVAR